MRKRPFRESIDAGGIRIVREGRSISVEGQRTPEEHRDLLARLETYRQDAPGRLTSKIAELEELLQPFNPLDLVAHLTLFNLTFDPETYKEYAHTGRQADVEYLTLLCLKTPYREGQARLVNGPALEPILKNVREIVDDTIWYYASGLAAAEVAELDLKLADLRLRSMTDGLLVRNPGYYHHVEDLLGGLFGSAVDPTWLESNLGCNIDDVIALVKAVGSVVEDKINSRRAQAREEAKTLHRAVRAYRRSQQTDEGGFPTELLKRLAGLRERHGKREIRNITAAWMFFALGDSLSFTTAELAASAGVSREKAQAYLDAFSIGFGDIPPDFVYPSITHPLQRRPIIRHPRGYLCPAPPMVHWAIRPRIEELLDPGSGMARGTDANVWQRYQKARGRFLVTEALRLLGGALRRGETHEGLKYTIQTATGSENYDLDGLVLFDTVAFLVEGKAGGMAPAARRGAQKSLLRDLQALVAEPYEQAIRARSYIANTDRPTFTAADGTMVVFDKQRYRQLILTTVSLEPLDPFVANLYELRELGIFKADELPWALQVLDLRVITELVEFPSQLIHFLQRRLRLNELGRIAAHDELDWFGHYLKEGLYFEDVLREGGPKGLRLLTYTTEIDDYYLYVTGARLTPAPKPAQRMPDLFRQLLKELEQNDGEGYVRVSTTLLELGEKERKLVAKYLQRIREQSARDGTFHDFTMMFTEAGFGLTLMSAGSSVSPDQFRFRVNRYATLKKYQQRLTRWVAIGTIVGLPGIVHGWVSLDASWEQDATMDGLIQRAFPQATDADEFLANVD